MTSARKPYPADASDDEWSLVVSDLTLVREDAPQRQRSLRALFNVLRYMVRLADRGGTCEHHRQRRRRPLARLDAT